MSEYTTESPASVAARQRRRRSLLTIGVILLGLFFAFWYGLSYYEADNKARASRPPAPTCRPFDATEVTPAEVTVNVYNATSRTGLAGSTAKLITDRGFVVDKVSNDPSTRKTPAVAEVRFGPAGAAAAKLVASVMPSGTKLVNDKRKGTGVDVALGTKFKALKPATAPSQELPMCPAPSAT
ncbi:LytR C-terminal domain-containing protein [Phycicoccus sp. HDW14]|uniref:LytR C-terminal domain-containing protein n=1 Tax=Phycicoccus sp. HDW14 TaxID=2714941 RepID=UPI00140E19C0|nr:LytR C-terminal domain-containing protein [Phycicoccus sp. HDW14]QIM22713.1 LytR C-terminal domain-containing protein [Phycicoccus sp. HDW14]